MKTVILCGGLGSRLSEKTKNKPKPMVSVGNLPILCHIMNIYKKYGFNDFILATGYKSEYIPPDLMKDQIPEGLIEYSNEFNFILACPLCPFGFYWRTTFVFSFVKHLIKKYRVNESKIFLSGTSMGAYGTWSTAHEFPDSFTAIAPVSGGVYEISQYQAHRFRNLPIWAFHNRGDEIIRCKDTENMIDSINKEGGKAKLTIYEVEGHDADVTFKKREVYEWFNSLQK